MAATSGSFYKSSMSFNLDTRWFDYKPVGSFILGILQLKATVCFCRKDVISSCFCYEVLLTLNTFCVSANS